MCLNIFRKVVLKEDLLIYMIKCEYVKNEGKKLYFFKIVLVGRWVCCPNVMKYVE